MSKFFKERGFAGKSVVLGTDPDGKKNGFGAILFDSEDTAEKAAKHLNKVVLGARYLMLNVISFGDYSRFNEILHNNPHGGGTRDIVNLVVFYDYMERALMMKGCPIKVSPE